MVQGMIQFAILFRCKQVNSTLGKSLTESGTMAWLTDDEGYWWGETFRTCPSIVSRDHAPANAIVFDSIEKAEIAWKQRRTFIGPWFVKPDGHFEVVPVRQKFKQVLDGYEVVK
jgi:hypothetical protein